MENKYWYLATPYAKYVDGHELAWLAACTNAGILMKHGVKVYCPIAHGHAINKFTNFDRTDHDFWMAQDAPMMANAYGLIVCKMNGWQESKGMSEEIQHFIAAKKPIVPMDPGVIPKEFLDD